MCAEKVYLVKCPNISIAIHLCSSKQKQKQSANNNNNNSMKKRTATIARVNVSNHDKLRNEYERRQNDGPKQKVQFQIKFSIPNKSHIVNAHQVHIDTCKQKLMHSGHGGSAIHSPRRCMSIEQESEQITHADTKMYI